MIIPASFSIVSFRDLLKSSGLATKKDFTSSLFAISSRTNFSSVIIFKFASTIELIFCYVVTTKKLIYSVITQWFLNIYPLTKRHWCTGGGSTLYKANSTYGFDYYSTDYREGNSGHMAIRANGNFVYTQNGTHVHKRSLATGAILATAVIPGGVSVIPPFSSGFQVANSGIDLDDCGNVYIGSSNAVVKYDANLNLLSQVATPYKVLDVNVSTGGDIIICGSTGNAGTNSRTGYIQSINMGACVPMTQICCDATICSAGPLCIFGSAITLQAASVGGVWSGQGITNTSTGVFNPATAGVGSHTIKYTLACGADSINIVACDAEIELPNIFTPNRDGINDNFIPILYKGILRSTMSIYDRWGNKIFTTDQPEIGWDGYKDGVLCSDQTCFWIMQYTTNKNESKELKGFLTIAK